VGNRQRRHVTKDVAPAPLLGWGCAQSIFPATPTVGGRRLRSLEPGGASMDSDRFWLLLLIGAAVLLMFVALERMYF
jgi:hypothetical protein